MIRAGLVMLALAWTAIAAAEPSVEPFHYEVAASIGADGELTADVTITLARGPATEHEFILSHRFELRSVEVSRHAAISVESKEHPRLGQLHSAHVRIEDPSKSPAFVRFRYQGPIFVSEEQDRLGHTPDCIEMALELMWLPLVAELNQRFTVDAELLGVPEDMVVVAQGDVQHQGERVRIHRKVADLDFAWTAVRGLKRVSAPGLEFYARDLDDPMVKVLRKHSLQAIAFHQKAFGSLPGGTVRLAVVPRKVGGAYARVGYIIIPQQHSTGEPAPAFSELSRAAVVAHEFAHAWWSPADPLSEDYWLAESIAQYSAWRYLEATFGREQLDIEIEKGRAAVKEMGVVLGHGRASRGVLYTKVPLLLMSLERRIGRDRFDQVLRTLAQQPPRKTQEFIAVLRNVAGDDAARDFEQWLRAG